MLTVCLIAVALLVGCMPDPRDALNGGGGELDAVQRTTVSAAGQPADVVLTEAEATEPQRAFAEQLGLPVAMGQPVQIDGEVPAGGLTIERVYETPLPEGAVATLAWYDEENETWFAAPSQISADRRTVSATVDHLSLWTDFVSGAEGTIVKGADWAYYGLGKVFEKRVDAPSCEGDYPGWVSSPTFIEDHMNNPIRFCVGRDGRNPEQLVVKARVNRGFGFIADVKPAAAWEHNSTFDKSAWEGVLSTLTELDATMASSVRDLTAEGRLVGPGEEIGFGFTEQAVRSIDGTLVLDLQPEPPGSFLASLVSQQIVSTGLSLSDGYLVAGMALAKCGQDGLTSAGAGDLAKAAYSCVSAMDGELAGLAGRVLAKHGVENAGKLAGKAVGKASVYLALVGPTLSSMSYIGEHVIDDATRQVSVFTTYQPKPFDVRNMIVPVGTCGGGDASGDGWDQKYPITLRDGEGEKFDDDQVGAGIYEATRVGATDITGDGRDEVVVRMRCTGSPAEYCCAGRLSMMDVVAVFDVSGPTPQRVGNTIWPTTVTGPSGDEESRAITPESVRLDGRTVVTQQYLVYPESMTEAEAAALEGEVRYTYSGGHWNPR